MSKTKTRPPALRKPTPKEELVSLHPIERVLLRLFEFLSSLKLAVALMFWLMLECGIGTWIESQVDPTASRFFVYGTYRFAFLLMMLGVNILCAALIRFPWQLHQTGFVITHTGLLIMLFGSLLTWRFYLDALMQVEKGQAVNEYFLPDRQQINVTYLSPGGKRDDERPEKPVIFRPGPFTWGHEILDRYPWKKDHVEQHTLSTGDVLTIKQFNVNCDAETRYVPAEPGVPALSYRLESPGRFDLSRWIGSRPLPKVTFIGQDSPGFGQILFWKFRSAEEREHFLSAAPKDVGFESPGTLCYSHGGKNYSFDVADLQKQPVAPPGSNVRLQVVGFLPNARFDRESNNFVNDDGARSKGEPMLRLKLTVEGEAEELWVFANAPFLNRFQSKHDFEEHWFTFFPAGEGASISLGMTTAGKVAYRAIDSRGLVANLMLEPNKAAPSWAGMSFTLLDALPSARADAVLKPRPIKAGKPEKNPGIVIELRSNDKVVETALLRQQERELRLGDALVRVGYNFTRGALPFKIRLDDFEELKNPGTSQAATFTSEVTVIDEQRKSERAKKITMNFPLYYTGVEGDSYTLFQNAISRLSDGTPISTFTVANDSGLTVKIVGLVVICVGIFLMFYMGGYFKRKPRA